MLREEVGGGGGGVELDEFGCSEDFLMGKGPGEDMMREREGGWWLGMKQKENSGSSFGFRRRRIKGKSRTRRTRGIENDAFSQLLQLTSSPLFFPSFLPFLLFPRLNVVFFLPSDLQPCRILSLQQSRLIRQPSPLSSSRPLPPKKSS